MERAHQLITQTDVPLIETAGQCGYRDYANFSAAFKRYFAQSPSSLHI